jgi:hypothetical protein
MGKLSIKGIVVGGVCDVVLTSTLALLVVAYVMLKLDLTNIPQAQLHTALAAALQSNTRLYALQLLIGMACSIVGGYIGARIAKHDELLNGLLTSFLCVAISVYSLVEGRVSGSRVLQLTEILASPALGLLGGYLRLAQKRANPLGMHPTHS